MPSFSNLALLFTVIQPLLAASVPRFAPYKNNNVGELEIRQTTSANDIRNDWQNTLSNDTRYRLEVAREHLDDESSHGQAFRNDTIMRINIEREALELSLVDLSQAFEMHIPTSAGVTVHRRDTEDREGVYLRSGIMTGYPSKRDVDDREGVYLRSGRMTGYPSKSSTDVYNSLLNQNNLVLGAIERINIARRILNQPELTREKAKEMASLGDEYVSLYWNSSMTHGTFWTADQPANEPNFIEGGQTNGFGFTQSTFHQCHCLANLGMMLAWHITGNGDKMTRDMNVHAIHCLEYIHEREFANPGLTGEPIDTVDYKGMGIH